MDRQKKIISTSLVSIQVLTMLYLFFVRSKETYFVEFLALLLGLALGLWALVVMGKSFSVYPHLKKSAQFVKKGPYKWVRHPMYLSLLIIFLPKVLVEMNGIYSIVFFLLLGTLVIKIIIEEKELGTRFKSFKKYQKGTKRIIPFIF